MTTTVAARLSEFEAREIERLAKEEDLDKSAFLKRLIHKGLQDYKINYALRFYKEKRISIGKAAEIAGTSTWHFIELMKQHNVYLNYGVDDLKSDVEILKKLGK